MVQDRYPRQCEGLKRLRKFYFPDLHFDNCQVFRGTLSSLPNVLQGSGDQAVVAMWRKNENSKRLHAATIEKFDFDGFDPTGWSIIVYYNLDGTGRGHQSVSRPSPSVQQFHDTSNNGPTPPFPNVAPPVSQSTPIYADPNDTIPPHSDRARPRSRSPSSWKRQEKQMRICRRRKIMSPERLHVADENWNVLDHKMMIGEGGVRQGDDYQEVIDLVRGMNQCNRSIEMNSIHLFLLFLLQMTLLWRILNIVHRIVHDRMMMNHL